MEFKDKNRKEINKLKDIINRRVSDRIGVKITEEGFLN
jgi:hypothetical protein